MNEPVWIKYVLVIAIHQRSLAEHGGSPKGYLMPCGYRFAYDGNRDKGLLESALFRPKNLLAYSEPTIFAKMSLNVAVQICYDSQQSIPFE